MDAWKTILSFPFLGFWWLFRGYVVFHFQGVFQSPKIMKLNWSPSIFSLWMDHSQVFFVTAISWVRETIPNRHRIAKAFPAFARTGCCSSDVMKGTQLNQPWNIWVFPKIGVPQNGWFTMENPIKMDDLGVPLFSKHPYTVFHQKLNGTLPTDP